MQSLHHAILCKTFAMHSGTYIAERATMVAKTYEVFCAESVVAQVAVNS